MNEDKAARYQRLKRGASVVSLAWSALFLAVLLFSGASQGLRDLAARAATPIPAPQWLLPLVIVPFYVVFLGALHEAGSLPIDFYRGFVLERRYGLATEQPRHWLYDHAKSSLLGLVFGMAGATFVYTALAHLGAWWWVIAGGGSALVALSVTMLGPVLLLPLFHRYRPLEREPLRARLVDLAARGGVPAVDAYEWRLSDRTRTANAALAGLGATRRILVSDTLLSQYSDDEIEVILAHELAHHVHRDIWKGIAWETALAFGGFFVAGHVLGLAAPVLGLRGRTDVAGLPVLLLGAMALSLGALPVANALSRVHEGRADRFALDLTRNPVAFTSAMRRLAAQNLAEERPSRLTRWLFCSHPPIEHRIAMAEGWGRSATWRGR